MMRYTINFEERMLEPAENGKWVKFEDVANIEAIAQEKADAKAQEATQKERERLHAQDAQIAALSEQLAQVSVDSLDAKQELQATIDRQRFMLKSAKDRLKLLGHSPNCFSRYGEVTADGQEAVNPCNCGLEDWLKESGVANG
jgi:hypothetical protein